MSSNISTDLTIYESFIQCLQQLSPQSNTQIDHSIVYSPTINPTAYTTILQSHIRNRRFDNENTPKPTIIITPTKHSHVQAAVICAKKLGVQILIRSGGHDYNGLSYVSREKNFILLDMYNLHNVTVDAASETAVIESGAHLGELFYRIWEKSEVHGFPVGVCLTVGAGGHISGGGYGTLIRKYGLSVDHVIDARIVDANGRVLDKKSMGEDLFWAIRGGGGASFGVILSYTVKLVPVPKVNTVFRITRTIAENAIDLVYLWQTVAPAIDRDLFIRVILEPETVNDKLTIRATFIAHFLGDSGRLLQIMNNNFPELGLKKEDCLEVSWVESAFYWANYDHTTSKEVLLNRHSENANIFMLRKMDYVQTPISKSGWESIFSKLVDLGNCCVFMNPYGGRMKEIREDATPCPHRGGILYKVQYWINWTEDDPKLDEKYLKEIRMLYEFMTKYVSKNPRYAYWNYRDLDMEVMGGSGVSDYKSGKVYETFFKQNFRRLVKIKTAVDPDNFFRNEQSIPTLDGIQRAEAHQFSRI
ncbi:hypothetical protein QVD17_13679 [Tagetes erecta]|uniref:FAD-binding PCMH-type domain-containing protein n=1 Tax=Tagetes erecta TaxID=13708 RepID=A0AAD8P290_TARER|nr:hypothetical protein QVD17_13679 [Tagetes erecta]